MLLKKSLQQSSKAIRNPIKTSFFANKIRSISTTPPSKMSIFSRQSHPFGDVFQSPLFLLEPFVDASQAHNNIIPSKRGERSLFSSNFFNGPKCDLHSTENEFILEAELPGIPKDQIKLEVDEKSRKITIGGEVKTSYTNHDDVEKQEHQPSSTDITKTDNNNKQIGQPSARTLISERSYGKIERSWVLPEKADLTKVTAKINDGILKVIIPFHKIEKSTPRSVTIEDSNE